MGLSLLCRVSTAYILSIMEANQLYTLRLGYQNYCIISLTHFGPAGPLSRSSITKCQVEAPEPYKYDRIKMIYAISVKIMKSRLKNNVCYVLIICWDHINGSHKIILTVDKMDRIKQYLRYVFTS